METCWTIYPPNSPLVASNVEKALEKAREYGVEATVLDLLQIHVSFDRTRNLTVTIPVSNDTQWRAHTSKSKDFSRILNIEKGPSFWLASKTPRSGDISR
jgi:hypothetical protein